MTKATKTARKIIVSIIGIPLFVIGLILIPLPGPGLLVSFLSLMILSLEFEWAGRQRDSAKARIKDIYTKAKARADKVENLGEKQKKD